MRIEYKVLGIKYVLKGKEQTEQKSHFLPGSMRKTVGLSYKAEANS